MKYSLRSLMIVVMVLPPLLAGGYFVGNRIYSANTEPAKTAPTPAGTSVADFIECGGVVE